MAIGRNDPCWCGSGTKFKKCHLGREDERPLSVQEEIDISRTSKPSICLHPHASSEACNHIIKAHTLQKSGQLQSIARDGKVYSCNMNYVHLIGTNGKRLPQLISINNASVFTGFCERHDKELFREIEDKPFELNPRTVSLLMYRAQAREFYTKDFLLRAEKKIRKRDRGLPKETQIAMHTYFDWIFEGARLGFEDTRARLDVLKSIVLGNDQSLLRFMAMRFPNASPVLVCGSFNPIDDLFANRIQDFADPGPIASLDLNILNIDESGLVIFSWLANESVADAFANSLDRSEVQDLDKIVLWLSFAYIENTFCNPNWWEGLEPDQQEVLSLALSLNIDPTLSNPVITYANFSKTPISMGIPVKHYS